ncbi:hypothetical protein [Crateriforma spongiae]|uniref:hypothetical protein n=1 Tax=Crateriforma spongiae TaxID=2724528 RepID=UPI0039B00C61
MNNATGCRLVFALVTTVLVNVTVCAAEPLTVTSLGRLPPGLTEQDEESGTEAKWQMVRSLLGRSADHVVVKQVGCNLGGNTSVRNSSPLTWKDKGYFRRARDLGQVFTAPHDFTLDAIVVRTGNGHLAFLPGAARARVFIQLFEVVGEPVINDNGTPPGTDATHGFSTNHRCDDTVDGVEYQPIQVVAGSSMPDLLDSGDGKLIYLKWSFSQPAKLDMKRGKQYAFMVGFTAPGPERNFTLANRNLASLPNPPTIAGDADNYPGGWGLRREGNGVTPPRKISGAKPPTDHVLLGLMTAQSSFPRGEARFAIRPTCEGYPDVDTYRDLEFYVIADH